jgi:glycosyltransferase involved in cell wall biosynthesis
MICLNMIVKNEQQVLPRLFVSVCPIIDSYLIVDTGSTDDTIRLIKQEMKKAGIPGKVYERPWVDFGHNRQQALELAVEANQRDSLFRKKANWLLFMDADDRLIWTTDDWKKKLETGTTYELEKATNNVRYAIPALIDISENTWQWKAPVHNYLQHLSGSNRRIHLREPWILCSHTEGAKSHGLTVQEKYLRDAVILENELKKNPKDCRSWFYLGQSYRDAGNLDKALYAYQARSKLDGWVEEKFLAALYAARIMLRLKQPAEQCEKALITAHRIRPSRAEPLLDLAKLARKQNRFEQSYNYAKHGVMLKQTDDRLFVEVDIYQWRMKDELAVAAYWAGHYQESLNACAELLTGAAPQTEHKRIISNMDAALKRLNV